MASITFEVECEVEGNVRPAEPDVGIMGPYIEDADLSSVSMLKAVRSFQPSYSVKYQSVDLLAGLDPKSRAIVIANIMEAFSDDVDEAILEDGR